MPADDKTTIVYGVCNVLRKLYNTCLNPRGYRVKVAAVVYQAWFES